MRTKGLFRKCFLTMVSALFALSFLMPTVLTISNSFMTQAEINANAVTTLARAAADGFSGEKVFCKKCGETIDADSVFCRYCGTKQSL